MQKEEKSFKKMSENHIKRTVFYEKRKNYRPFVFKYFVRVECWCKKEEIICYFLIFARMNSITTGRTETMMMP